MTVMETDGFGGHRALLFSMAYRMLGSASDAEDIVHDAYLRHQNTDTTEIRHPKAYWGKIVTRLCLNQLRSARRQREQYIGPWLPEPVASAQESPAHKAELNDTVSLALLTLLQQLSPAERAVFLLRDVFDYGYDEIAAVVDKAEPSCRQLYSRARKHIDEHSPRFNVTPEKHRLVLERFAHAASTGDLQGMLSLLSEDVTLVADSGGKARGATLEPLFGRERVGRFVVGVASISSDRTVTEISEINGEPALVVWNANVPIVVLAVETDGTTVIGIKAMGNPDKLRRIGGRV